MIHQKQQGLAVLNYCYYWACFQPSEDSNHSISYFLHPQILPSLLSRNHNNVIFSVYNRFQIEESQPDCVFQLQSVKQWVEVNL